ncbi:hypothetical protein [Sphingobium estronivorans]|uniref:hypothetical protein n=1 Tax=Sphingobium estronivorans TaxID=1577690 RepID=UPI0013C349DD|nr:hypothetical protein [Sphingobium estronivorans]
MSFSFPDFPWIDPNAVVPKPLQGSCQFQEKPISRPVFRKKAKFLAREIPTIRKLF